MTGWPTKWPSKPTSAWESSDIFPLFQSLYYPHILVPSKHESHTDFEILQTENQNCGHGARGFDTPGERIRSTNAPHSQPIVGRTHHPQLICRCFRQGSIKCSSGPEFAWLVKPELTSRPTMNRPAKPLPFYLQQ